MSQFYFAAIGNKQEVLGQLENADTRGSIVGCRVRDLIADAIKTEPDFYQPGQAEFFNISVHGHSGDQSSPFTLSVSIQSRYMPRSE